MEPLTTETKSLSISRRVRVENDVARIRQEAFDMAERLGFSRTRAYAVTTSVSELANNLLCHAGDGGLISLSPVDDCGVPGIEVVCLDDGPGITDIGLAMQDGYSTNGGLGGGLPGVKRLMDEFSILSELGEGTKIAAIKWSACARSECGDSPVAVLRRPVPGQAYCGDQFASWQRKDEIVLCAVDGLGHGIEAFKASSAAIDHVSKHIDQSFSDIFEGCDCTIRKTRGVAMTIAIASPQSDTIHIAGIGNVECRVVGVSTRTFCGSPGIVGRGLRKLRIETAPLLPGDMVILHTDGISAKFGIDRRHFQMRNLSQVAASIMSEYARERDDAGLILYRRDRE